MLMGGGCGRVDVPKENYFKGRPLPHWLEAIRDPDPKVRHAAAEVLGNAGPSDPAIVPALIEALKDKNAKVRAAAALSLAKMGSDAASAASDLQKLIGDPDPTVRANAAIAVERTKR
jgi:HEAT repeat protein